uniref:Small ribosomal subunit protein bS20c n=1 Tax=Cyanophora paradoxa TaxID=2762 RepID=RR20_CYAPA|nr:ribosomal protein S20 [Cyanophora paradoxa]P48140.1 RecName: Full=Small ribosomal subunit protein bS20c; AltName: Full=Cyanelle 30S ribosomal protein S20 [Cyanophora paradoxa]AAA81248.1 ribosomal protein S20 [Cyanophora paradoxa]
MANTKSAIKRIKTIERNRIRNCAYKSVVKTFIKKYLKVLSDYTNAPNSNGVENIQTTLGIVYTKIDKAVKRGVYHSNKAARMKSKLALKYNVIKK